ncbi:MAG TPA: FtsX-like permease family protein [Vicinamibacterales bacterium]|nr:FtsX-like permease family protein [Vicinamibacterales bacterium]
MLARLPGGTQVGDVEARLNSVVRGLMPAFPTPRVPPAATAEMVTRAGPFSTTRFVPVVEHVARRVRSLFLGILLTAVLLVTVASVNVSGLMIARGFNRRRDLSVRRAMGARATDLVRLVVIESTVLVSAGAVLGLAATPQLIALATQLLPVDLQFFSLPALEGRVVAFALLMTICAALATAVVPAWRAARQAHIAGPALAPAPPGRRATRTVVLALQIAGSLVLAIGGTLFVTSLITVERSDIGIDLDHVAAADIRLLPESADRSGQMSARKALAEALLVQIRSLPSVDHAAMTSSPLFTRNVRSASVQGPASSGARFFAGGQEVTSGFREVLAPRLLEGRWFTDEEIASRADVAVIDEVAARGWWPNARAVGQTLRGFSRQSTVIGVTAEARYYAWDLHGRVATVYQPASFAQGDGQQTLIVRGPDADRARKDAIEVLRRAAPTVRISRSGALTALIADSIRERRLQSWLFGSLAAAALVILGVGVLGFVAMSTVSRTREIGVRVALGATPSHVVGLLAREQIAGVSIGIAAGLALAAWGLRALETYLYQLTPYDSRVWAVAILVVLVTTLIGTLIPARLSACVDPMMTLRAE